MTNDERLEHVTSFRVSVKGNFFDVYGFNESCCAYVLHNYHTGEVLDERYVPLKPDECNELKRLAASAKEDDASQLRNMVYESMLHDAEESIVRCLKKVL